MCAVAARGAGVIRVEAVWLATQPLDMRAGIDSALARVVAVFGAAQPHQAYVFANRSGTRLDKISAELAANSACTREILEATRDLRDVVITARTGGKFARWLAPTVIAIAASVGVLKGWWTDASDWFSR